MARPKKLTVAQYDLLKWVADGSPEDVYDGYGHRLSARALANRDLISITGKGDTWHAAITTTGTEELNKEKHRIETMRRQQEREAREQQQREEERRQRCTDAASILEEVKAAGEPVDLVHRYTDTYLTELERLLQNSGGLPSGEKLAHEPTRMDPALGYTAYLRPDYEARIQCREITVPRQLRSPSPAVAAFSKRKANVSKERIPRAARVLQALVNESQRLGWIIPDKIPSSYTRDDYVNADLEIRLPDVTVQVLIRELDERGRPGRAFVDNWDYYAPRPAPDAKRIKNRSFSASGRLEVTVWNQWHDHDRPLVTIRDHHDTTVENSVGAIFRKLEIMTAEAEWDTREHQRRSVIREDRWEEVQRNAFTRLSYHRNTNRALDQLQSLRMAAGLRDYSSEIVEHAVTLPADDQEKALAWARWIREHADTIDPLNGPLTVEHVTTCSHEELQPFMDGWSTHSPYRH